MPDLALATVIIPIWQGKLTTKTKFVFNSNENHAPAGQEEASPHQNVYSLHYSVLLLPFSFETEWESHTVVIKTQAGNISVMQCLSASESSIWAFLEISLEITATLFQGLCTMNEAKPRKRNFTHKQTIFTHNRIRGTHSKIFSKQYLDLFLPTADIPDSFDINTSPTMCMYGYTVYYRITLVSCRDKQNSQLYFSIW